MKLQLRDYQQRGVNEIRSRFRAGDRNVLYQLSTGGGKTICFCYITEGAARRGNSVLILVHRQELIRQTSRSLNEIGVSHGIIAPGFTPSFDLVQIASVQTLVRRLHKITPPRLIISDECHHATATSWAKIFNYFPEANILGVTATPCRLDGRGLGRHCGGFFDSMVNGPPLSDLIRLGHLSRPVLYAPPVGAQLDSLRKRYGEFVTADAAAVMDKPVITGNAVEHYRRLCAGMPAIAFCASVAHAEHVAEQFRAAGFQAASIDGGMHDNERKGRIAALGNGHLNVLTSCDIISEGTDIPVVGGAILLRPTASLSLCMQQIGRALRVFPGKEKAVILDHVGNIARHRLELMGHPDGDIEWSLDGETGGKSKKGEQEETIKTKQCEQCYAVHLPSPKCPYCGYEYQTSVREIASVSGELEEIDAEQIERDRAKQFRAREEAACKTLEDWQALAESRGYKPGWAHHRFNARQGRRPPALAEMRG